MSIFKEHKTNADRVASDRRHHKEKIEKAIREGIKDIVADKSIIGKDGKKTFMIPIQGIKEHRFVYGDNGKHVGYMTQSKKYNEMVPTMVKDCGYSEESAEEILAFAANNLRRDS